MATKKSRQEAVLEPENSEGSTCPHHWIIDSPAGPVSRGVCRLCGEKGEFKNFLEGSNWSGDTTSDEVSIGGRIPVSVNTGEAEDYS